MVVSYLSAVLKAFRKSRLRVLYVYGLYFVVRLIWQFGGIAHYTTNRRLRQKVLERSSSHENAN